MSGRVAVLLAAVTAAAVGVAAADGGRLLLRDDRLRIIAPPERARIDGAFTVAWEARRPAGATAFAVFVDRPPMRPGRTLADLARDDPLCRMLPDCPDRRWLRANNIHVTRRAAVRLPRPAIDGGRRTDGGRRHLVTVVLLDGRGARTGEGAWQRVVLTEDPPQ